MGFNPDAAAYGGISVKKNYVRAMAISGASPARRRDWTSSAGTTPLGVLDVQASTVGFLGIAVALLGRNTAVGVGLAALVFGALLYGTTQGLDPNVFEPNLRETSA